MKRAMTIIGMLLLAFAISCRKADTNEGVVGDAAVKTKAIPETAGAETRPVDPLDECQTLIEAARKVNSIDTKAAMAAWGEVAERLHDCMYTSNQVYWLQMKSEVEKARARIMQIERLLDLMANLEDIGPSGDRDRLLATLKTATTQPKPDVSPELLESWISKIDEFQEEADFAEIGRLLTEDKFDAAVVAVDAFVEKYPENSRGKAVKLALKEKADVVILRKEAIDLFNKEKWAEALEKFKILRRIDMGGDHRKYGQMRRRCQYELEMVKLDAAIKAGDYAAAIATGEKARVFNSEAWETEIMPKLAPMMARRKVADTLVKGAEALKKGQYSDVRKILDHLKDSDPKAAKMIRQSRYREYLAKGDAAQKEDDFKSALAHYKIARHYAKDAAEHKEIDALISEVTKAIDDS